MEKRPLGNTGLSVSPLGFGSAPIAFLKTDPQQAAAMLNELLDAGMNVLDTAAMYPGAEAFIGEHFSHRRDDYVLISKCGTKVEGIDEPLWSRKLITKSIDHALGLLKTDAIDVMLLHSCDLKILERGEAIGALVDARKAGKIRFAGYSGDNEAVAVAARHPEVAAVEMSINVADQVNIDLGLSVANELGRGVIAKRPIANAAWKDIKSQPGMYASYAKTYTERLSQMNLSPNDLGIGGPPELAWPELALRFTLAQPGVSTAIIGTTNAANAKANLNHAAQAPLPAATIQTIRKTFAAAQKAERWTGQT